MKNKGKKACIKDLALAAAPLHLKSASY